MQHGRSVNLRCICWFEKHNFNRPFGVIFVVITLHRGFINTGAVPTPHNVQIKPWRAQDPYGEQLGNHYFMITITDKSLARPRRKQATATKLEIYSTYSPRSSLHFLARCCKFCKPLKKNSEICPSNLFTAAAMTSASNEKWRHFNCFFF